MYLIVTFNAHWDYRLPNKIQWCVYSMKGNICSSLYKLELLHYDWISVHRKYVRHNYLP